LPEHWLTVARHTPLGILCDLDGTLVPFASSPEEARPDANVVRLVEALASQAGVTMAIVSGRPKDWLEAFFQSPNILLVAEHGASRRGAGAWELVSDLAPAPLADLCNDLERLAEKHPGALLERKNTTVALHYRNVRRGRRGELLVEAYGIIDGFLASYPAYERLEGVLVCEIRPAAVKKSSAVTWAREKAGPGARLVAIGDDVTDEHMFQALDATDEAIIVRTAEPRRTVARWELTNSDEVRTFLAWVMSANSLSPNSHSAKPNIKKASPVATMTTPTSPRT
jgi:trehalose-phosphatase